MGEPPFFIRTYTGKLFYWDDVYQNEYDIRDIAHALANNCRWTGHTKHFYSVAQHSVLASYNVSKKSRLQALMHDASEAYVHDTPSPLKWWLQEKGFTTFRMLTEQIEYAIAYRFRFQWPMSLETHTADQRLLATEARDLMPQPTKISARPYRAHITCVSPQRAEREFLARFKEITNA